MSSIAAIILAGGASTRMGGVKKEYRLLPPFSSRFDTSPENGRENDKENENFASQKTVLAASLIVFSRNPLINRVVIVHQNIDSGENDAKRAIGKALLEECSANLQFVAGGSSRRLSVFNALSFLSGLNAGKAKTDYVLIHDGARPWVDAALVNRVIESMKIHGAAIPVTPLNETPKIIEKMIDNSGFIVRHLKRRHVFNAQTPQGFLFDKIFYAHHKAEGAAREAARSAKWGAARDAAPEAAVPNPNNDEWTDDAEIYAAFAGAVYAVEGNLSNKKITRPEDLRGV